MLLDWSPIGLERSLGSNAKPIQASTKPYIVIGALDPKFSTFWIGLDQTLDPAPIQSNNITGEDSEERTEREKRGQRKEHSTVKGAQHSEGSNSTAKGATAQQREQQHSEGSSNTVKE